MINNIPELVGSRICLRPFKIEDSQDLFEYASNEITMQYIDWGPFRTVIEAENYIKNSNKGVYEWAIELIQLKKVIGSIVVYSITTSNTCEIAFIISQKYWNNGYATESINTLLLFLSKIGIKKVYAKHVTENIASGCALLKAGFHVFNKYEKKFKLKTGEELNCIEYEYII